MASRKKVRRQSSLDNLLSLFRRKPKQKAGKPERPRSGSLDVPARKPSVEPDVPARKPSVEPGVPARKPSVEPDVPVVKIERHYSDITPRPKLTIPLRNARAAQFTTKLSNQRDHNIRLRSLDKASMSGFLEHKQVTRWALLWAVVRDHTLYGFESQDPDEEQILLINLEDCSLVPSSKTIFRLCQFNAHSLYFRVKDGAQKWISALETITNSRDSRVTSPKINSLVLASTQPRSPSRSPNGMVKTLNLHASPRDPRRAVTKEADEGITFTARNYDADKVDITEKFTRRESHHDVTLQEVWRSSNDVIGPDKGEEDDAGGIIIHKEPVSPDSVSLKFFFDRRVFD
ncbi:hypothetical protein CAPTEDRAFT_205543 [Capitella teleta]|uniref:PH domain-containing protein n=1 Tax=Capitella teleta TaxID=283909 RepID=R7U437_CAPTE|nr:hypothetical protein CAPTEDRAFT_205543 [Capitella teleta]|eukprot:ELT98436.1 hypothetical protein CAPTEDRAFT_205543 [Capitella teleta]